MNFSFRLRSAFKLAVAKVVEREDPNSRASTNSIQRRGGVHFGPISASVANGPIIVFPQEGSGRDEDGNYNGRYRDHVDACTNRWKVSFALTKLSLVRGTGPAVICFEDAAKEDTNFVGYFNLRGRFFIIYAFVRPNVGVIREPALRPSLRVPSSWFQVFIFRFRLVVEYECGISA